MMIVARHKLLVAFRRSRGTVVFHLDLRTNVHGNQFLEKEFAGIGNFDARDIGRGLAVLAPPEVAKEPALAAHISAKLIGGDHEALHDQHAEKKWW